MGSLCIFVLFLLCILVTFFKTYLDVKVQICCIMVLVSISIHFLELLWPEDGSSFGAEIGRRLINIYIKLCWLWLEGFRLLYWFMKAAHILCTATVSTVDIKKQLTDRIKKLTAWSGVLLEKLTGPQLVKKSHVTETDLSLPHSKKPATWPYPEPDQHNPSPVPLLGNPFQYFPSINALAFLKDYFPQVPPPKHSVDLSCPTYVLLALIISYFFFW